jgi:hypothetical protein
MIDLPGQKLHAKRNFINRFAQPTRAAGASNPSTRTGLDELYGTRPVVQGQPHQRGRPDGRKPGDREPARNGRALNVRGGALRLDGKVIGFSLGTFITPDVFCVHIEKADWMIPGAYQVLANEVAKACCSGVRLINREDDMGIEGLRKAKMSYQPDEIAMKHIAVLA